MEGDVLTYIVIGIVALLAIFSFLLWTQQMIKLIIGNYVIWLLVLAFSMSITIAIQYFKEHPDGSLLWIDFSKFESLFQSGQITLVLLLYIASVLILFTQTDFRISLPTQETQKNIAMVLLIPLTIFSIILGLEIAIFGQKLFHIQELVLFSTKVTTNQMLYSFLVLTPVWIFFHAVATLYLLTLLRFGNNDAPSGSSWYEETPWQTFSPGPQ